MQSLLSHLGTAFLARFDIQGKWQTSREWKVYHNNAHFFNDLISRDSLKSLLSEVELKLPPGDVGRAAVCCIACIYKQLPHSQARATFASSDKYNQMLESLKFLRIRPSRADSP